MENVKGQEIKPDYYWNFEGQNPEKPVLGESTIKAENLVTRKNNGVFGQYLHFDKESEGPIKMKLDGFDKGFSIDFWVRFSKESFQRNTRLFWARNSDITILFNKKGLNFGTSLYQPNGEKKTDNLVIKLKGGGRNSLGYYLDDQWHHFVFKYDIRSGKKEIWIDGDYGEGFSKKVDFVGKFYPKGSNFKMFHFGYQNDGNKNFTGDLDEVRIYHRFIPESLHLSHFQEANLKPRKTTTNLPQPSSKDKENYKTLIDPIEFPKQHPNVTTMPLDQLKQFPSPRYKSGNTLLPIFNWMAPSYMAGGKIKGLTKTEKVKNTIDIQEELAKRWNYMLVISNVKFALSDKNLYNDDRVLRGTINLANQHPEYPLGVISLWAQLSPRALNKEERKPAITGKGLSSDYFLKNSQNQFLNRKGEISNQKHFSFAASDDFCDEDGKILEFYFKRILGELTRPIDLINENGEVPPLPLQKEILEKDPKIVSHKNKLGEKDWSIYQAKQKTRFRQSYLSRSQKLPQLSSTHFSWYGVDGGPEKLNRFEWVEARKIGSKINGQYYSTPDFYPRWPGNWEKWRGAWRGWRWIKISREKEILAGDKLFSPFIGAGWDKRPEKNVRPSQWLGLLKHLGVIGAEFFYSGFFNEGRGDNIEYADPRNYVWQAAIPSYAQAITSHYEDILRNGNVLFDEKGIPIIRHDAGDPRILVTVRKHDQAEKYIISGNINPNSNVKGNVEDKSIASIRLNGKKLSFEIRRQGSVYYYDATNSQKPIFYQLDTWHQLGHPSHWTRDLLFEAEVFDDSKNLEIVTEKPNRTNLDFSKFHTYIQSKSKKACGEYAFSLSENQFGKFRIMLKARTQSGKSTGASIYLDNKLIGKIECINNRNWEWIDLNQCDKKALEFSIQNTESHKLEIRLKDSSIQLEQIKLKAI